MMTRGVMLGGMLQLLRLLTTTTATSLVIVSPRVDTLLLLELNPQKGFSPIGMIIMRV
jgi:hypothetical protein